MKKYLLSLVLLMVVFNALNKDNHKIQNQIKGIWYLHSLELNDTIKILKNKNCKQSYIEFKRNGKFKTVIFDDKNNCEKSISKGVYRVENGKIISKITNQEKEIFEYKILKDTMYMFKINKRTQNKEKAIFSKF